MTALVDAALADAWQASWSRLVGLLIGQYQRPDLAEDAVADAFESAARHWPTDGVPTSTGAWLLTAARRRVLDRLRTEAVHRRKEPLMAVDDEMRAAAAAVVDPFDGAHVADEQLRLVFACCHPALAADDRVALTLRFVVGLTTAEIARLLLVQETAMAARLTRAKKRLASSGIPFAVPPPGQLDSRLDAVATVLYLMFTSGYQPGSGPVTLARRPGRRGHPAGAAAVRAAARAGGADLVAGPDAAAALAAGHAPVPSGRSCCCRTRTGRGGTARRSRRRSPCWPARRGHPARRTSPSSVPPSPSSA